MYVALLALPEKQAKRIYARYYLGMSVSEIAAAKGVDPSRIQDSIRRGLKRLAKKVIDFSASRLFLEVFVTDV